MANYYSVKIPAIKNYDRKLILITAEQALLIKDVFANCSLFYLWSIVSFAVFQTFANIGYSYYTNFIFNDFALFFVLCLRHIHQIVEVVFLCNVDGIFTSCIALPFVPQLKKIVSQKN